MKKILISSSVFVALSTTFTIEQDSNFGMMIADPQQCIEEKCPDQWAACQKDAKCAPTLQGCNKKCGTGKTCWEFCLSKAGDTPATNVAKCAAANGCLSQPEIKTSTALMVADPQQCIEEKCPDQWAACQKDAKCTPTLQGCEKKCGTGKTCWQMCLSKAGDSAATNVAKCAAAEHCLSSPETETSEEVFQYPFEQCINKSCSIPFSECLGDNMCRKYLRQCRNPEGVWNFNFDCLVEKSAFSPKLNTFFNCSGHYKCI